MLLYDQILPTIEYFDQVVELCPIENSDYVKYMIQEKFSCDATSYENDNTDFYMFWSMDESKVLDHISFSSVQRAKRKWSIGLVFECNTRPIISIDLHTHEVTVDGYIEGFLDKIGKDFKDLTDDDINIFMIEMELTHD
jgi:hypothetical protein